MSVDARLAALEKKLGRSDDGKVGCLLIWPDADPSAEIVGPDGQNIRVGYREDQLDEAGDPPDVAELIPPGPDHDRLVAMARTRRHVILTRYKRDWRADPLVLNWGDDRGA